MISICWKFFLDGLSVRKFMYINLRGYDVWIGMRGVCWLVGIFLCRYLW